MTTNRKRGRPRKVRLTPDEDRRLGRTNLHERAGSVLRAMIVRGDLEPGETLVEGDLCDRLGVSRTPLREALKLLAADGLVELRQNRSPRVSVQSAEQIRDLFETIGALERRAAERAALAMTPSELSAFRALHETMEAHFREGRREDYFALNQQIHLTVVRAAGNVVLEETHGRLLASAERARYLALQSRERWSESIGDHWALLEAIEARDPSRAGEILAAHVMETGRAVVRSLEAREQDAALLEREDRA